MSGARFLGWGRGGRAPRWDPMTVADPQTPTRPEAGRPQPPAARTRLCRCGHVRTAHEHYRRGTDCALCDCGRYRGRFTLLR
ncbi:hypothetical protein DQ238_19900 [Geodermatophilus sp. TF02-6]|nr:hypothetical protein DQ238_19900 [Geodermatophilus sp. TF02-6]